MCLAMPMQLIRLADDGSGIADLDGIHYTVDLSLIEDPAVGDYIIVHAGFGIEKLNREEADERLQLFARLAAGDVVGTSKR